MRKYKINPPERKRIYNFPNNEKIIIENVCVLIITNSGCHKLKTTNK